MSGEKGNGHAEGLCDAPRKNRKKKKKKTKNSVIVFPCERIEDILILPDLHKSSVICYRLNKIIFTERRSKRKKKIKKRAMTANLIVRYDRARNDVRIPKSLCECAGIEAIIAKSAADWNRNGGTGKL